MMRMPYTALRHGAAHAAEQIVQLIRRHLPDLHELERRLRVRPLSGPAVERDTYRDRLSPRRGVQVVVGAERSPDTAAAGRPRAEVDRVELDPLRNAELALDRAAPQGVADKVTPHVDGVPGGVDRALLWILGLHPRRRTPTRQVAVLVGGARLAGNPAAGHLLLTGPPRVTRDGTTIGDVAVQHVQHDVGGLLAPDAHLSRVRLEQHVPFAVLDAFHQVRLDPHTALGEGRERGRMGKRSRDEGAQRQRVVRFHVRVTQLPRALRYRLGSCRFERLHRRDVAGGVQVVADGGRANESVVRVARLVRRLPALLEGGRLVDQYRRLGEALLDRRSEDDGLEG